MKIKEYKCKCGHDDFSLLTKVIKKAFTVRIVESGLNGQIKTNRIYL